MIPIPHKDDIIELIVVLVKYFLIFLSVVLVYICILVFADTVSFTGFAVPVSILTLALWSSGISINFSVCGANKTYFSFRLAFPKKTGHTAVAQN